MVFPFNVTKKFGETRVSVLSYGYSSLRAISLLLARGQPTVFRDALPR
jgi:hypothetical protein